MSRGNILRTLLGLTLLGEVIGIVLAWRARFVTPYRARVQNVVVSLPRKHSNLSGLTIAFVTDTHVGPHFKADDLIPVAEQLERIRPDIVLFGGDYICESPRFMKQTAPMMGRMARTARYGAWGVVGNHDLANTRGRVMPPLEAEGISLLANQAVAIATERGTFWLVGVDDALLGSPDLNAAFDDVPVDAATICLWHEPDRAAEAAPYGPFLLLSGHTHGGQVRLPFIGPLAAPEMGRKYVMGRFQIDDMELYVSRGLGMYRPPVRFNCSPELTIIRLID
jgi:predicted MPP superfamily phosphohydrolase